MKTTPASKSKLAAQRRPAAKPKLAPTPEPPLAAPGRRPPKKPERVAPRRRLSREDALELILEATEKRLRASGPDALRIQEIAEDVGMSHPTVLHHVGSREELVHAVCSRAILTLEGELIEVFTAQAGKPDIASTLHQIDEVLRHRGQARLIAWLALTQPRGSGTTKSRLGDVVRALHAARATEAPDVSLEETTFAVILASAAMVGASLLGPELFEMAGAPSGEPAMKRFREWFAALMLAHAERVDGAAPPNAPVARTPRSR